MTVSGLKKVKNAHGMLNGQECLGISDPERSNTLERTVENVHASKMKETLEANLILRMQHIM
jgi:hypothetical protein